MGNKRNSKATKSSARKVSKKREETTSTPISTVGGNVQTPSLNPTLVYPRPRPLVPKKPIPSMVDPSMPMLEGVPREEDLAAAVFRISTITTTCPAPSPNCSPAIK